MLKMLLRVQIVLFTLMAGSILLFQWDVYHRRTITEIKSFVRDVTNCGRTCFEGIVIDQTSQDGVYRQLELSDYIDDYQMQIVERGERQIVWTWNGTQPDVFIEGSYTGIRYGENAQYVVLPTTLTVGDAISIFGEPDLIIETLLNVFLCYAEDGFYVEVTANCDAIWHSPVRISVRPRMDYDTGHDITAIANAIEATCY